MIASLQRGRTAAPPDSSEAPSWRAVAAAPIVAGVTLLAALIVTRVAGVDLRDPNGSSVGRFTTAAMLVGGLIVVDVVARGGRARWTPARLGAVIAALVSFYVTYLAYRNLKSVVPLITSNLYDGRLGDVDRSVFAGSDPAAVLHDLLGTGASAHVLAGVYELFFVFIPIALAVALVLFADVRGGLFLTTALALNWTLAAGSYFLLPSLGPVYADPGDFAQLPSTGVSHLQEFLLNQRVAFLRDPSAGGAQSIGAFASLHVSIFFTSALATHLLGLARPVKIVVWALFALTATATIYFGWHYLLDDLAGLLIGITALALARGLTAIDLRTAREPVAATSPSAA